MTQPSQGTRLLVLGLYVLLLCGASRLALGTWWPPTTDQGLWFYSGVAAVLLGSLLETPHFTTPKDAISNAVGAGIALAAINVRGSQLFAPLDRALWTFVMVYATFIVAASILAMTLKDSPDYTWNRLAESMALLSATLGGPRYVFSAVYLFALVVFHRNEPRQYLVISIAWALVVGLQPLETVAYLWGRFRGILADMRDADRWGIIVGHHSPRIVLIRQESDHGVSFGEPLLLQADDGRPDVAMVLDHVGFVNSCWVRAYQLSLTGAVRDCLPPVNTTHSGDSAVFRYDDYDDAALQNSLEGNEIWRNRARLVGFVAPDSDIGRLKIEVVRTDVDLQEGALVTARIGTNLVMYQVVNGLTAEEILRQKSTRGYVRAEARKVGAWNADLGAFQIIEWVPSPNAPVFLADSTEVEPHREAIGHFPRTNYPVGIRDIDTLVTHNAAILGILGVGKTYLALELVERMIDSGIKVLCLDLTDQYAQHLAPFYDAATVHAWSEALSNVGAAGRANVQRNVEEGGSIRQFKEKLVQVLRSFLDPDSPQQLAIFNPTDFVVWRQDSRPYNNMASMASITPPHITRLFAEATLEILQAQEMTDKARCCLVFEEAHSLVPEWSSAVDEGDRSASNGTARAIVQGRKFGLGCLLVTQRTANVIKSILNQCNTVFALRIFDATGMSFLKNYIGSDFASVLPTLEDRHAVFFGRASTCRDPVYIRLNDRSDFLEAFRAEEPVA